MTRNAIERMQKSNDGQNAESTGWQVDLLYYTRHDSVCKPLSGTIGQRWWLVSEHEIETM